VLTLRQNGIQNAAAILGGYQAWVSAGLPVEAAPQQ
jgi:rhodanese-related sulfurtransferase